MTEPDDLLMADDLPQPGTTEAAAEKPRTVRVPIRRRDSVFSSDEYAEVDVDAAGQWDAREWRDHPL